MSSACHDIVVKNAFDVLIRHRGHHAEQEMFPLQEQLISTLVICVLLFHVLSWILSFDCSFCLIAWYLYIFYFKLTNYFLSKSEK